MVMVLRWVVALPLLLGAEMALVIAALSLFVDGQVQAWAFVSAATSSCLALLALAAAYLIHQPD